MKRPSSCSSSRRARFRRAAAVTLLAAVGTASDTRERNDRFNEPPLPSSVREALASLRGAGIVGFARVLSDPAYRGREASTPESRKAAAYVADQFRAAGVQPGAGAGSYFQAFKIEAGYEIESTLTVALGKRQLGDFACGRDYMPLYLPEPSAEIRAGCVLAGYGISAPALAFDEYELVDAKGTAVLVFAGVPAGGRYARWAGHRVGGEPIGTIRAKARTAAAHGAVCLLVVDNPSGWRTDIGVIERLRTPDRDALKGCPIPVVHVTRDFVACVTTLSPAELRLLARDIARDGGPHSQPLRGRRLSYTAAFAGRAQVGRNVVGVLPGRDERLRREAVVLGAHYDHLGAGEEEIFFGADDNAAGVGALLSIAGAFARLPLAPRRTVIFVAFDAEEIGRRGSRSYVSRPSIAVEETVLMINFDMIGRGDENHINAVGTRSSPALHALHQELNRHVGLRLSHPASFRLGRSDHTAFYNAGVPIMYLFGGLHADYNTPRDTWDKLIPAKVERVARLAFLTAYAVAERSERLPFHAWEDGEELPLPIEDE
jgi:hypothetical protein